MVLKADFHIHTHFSPDSGMLPERLVARCLKVGLNCIAVTDHNTIQGALTVRGIAPFKVIIGSEIKSSQGEITGLFLKEEIPRGLSALETARRIKEQGGIVSIPHPFDHFRRSVITRDGLEEVLPLVDIIEGFNARNTLSRDNERAQALAKERGLLMSGVSDSHTTLELGRTYTEIPDFDDTPEGFMKVLAQGKIVGHRTNPLIHLVTRYTVLKNRLLGRWGK